MRTGYPHDGKIRVEVLEAPGRDFGIALRIPAWAKGASMSLNGVKVTATEVLRVPFAAGDVVVLDLPMEPRRTYPHPQIDAVRGTVAVERGPLVLCVEDVDLPAGYTVDDIELDPRQGLRVDAMGRTVVHARLRPQSHAAWPYSDSDTTLAAGSVDVAMVPYFRWGNRGPATMRVWIPTAESSPETPAGPGGKEA
jgi:DUF1680 family protein